MAAGGGRDLLFTSAAEKDPRESSPPPPQLPALPAGSFLRRLSMSKDRRFSDTYVDFFDNPSGDEVRRRAQAKAIEMRSQGWSGAAMLPYSELEYGGFRDTVTGLLERFRLHRS
jgi:Fructose-1,6-bisphosphatase